MQTLMHKKRELEALRSWTGFRSSRLKRHTLSSSSTISRERPNVIAIRIVNDQLRLFLFVLRIHKEGEAASETRQ